MEEEQQGEDSKEEEGKGEAEAKEEMEMHVLVMDNHSATGPSLWINYFLVWMSSGWNRPYTWEGVGSHSRGAGVSVC